MRHRAAACYVKRRWMSLFLSRAFWRDDETAQALGLAAYGCPYCGHGAAQEVPRTPGV